jgi:hypothetical protein
MALHSEHSSNREKLLEHLFIGDILRHLWRHGVTSAEFLRPEVDCGGYDLVISCNKIMRHIQLKSSHRNAKTARQNVNLRLSEKPSGCVVWMLFDERTLDLGPFMWFGGPPGRPLPDISKFPTAKHTKGNADGVKAERPNIRVLKRASFEVVQSVSELVERLFGHIEDMIAARSDARNCSMGEARITRKHIDELLRFLPVLSTPGPGTQAQWQGLNQDSTTRVFTMPYPEYPPVVEEFFKLAAQDCWCDSGYQKSSASEMIHDDTTIASASLAQIKSMLTFCVRGERFCDGHWDAMVQKGRIAAILRRLSQLRDEAPET